MSNGEALHTQLTILVIRLPSKPLVITSSNAWNVLNIFTKQAF